MKKISIVLILAILGIAIGSVQIPAMAKQSGDYVDFVAYRQPPYNCYEVHVGRQFNNHNWEVISGGTSGENELNLAEFAVLSNSRTDSGPFNTGATGTFREDMNIGYWWRSVCEMEFTIRVYLNDSDPRPSVYLGPCVSGNSGQHGPALPPSCVGDPGGIWVAAAFKTVDPMIGWVGGISPTDYEGDIDMTQMPGAGQYVVKGVGHGCWEIGHDANFGSGPFVPNYGPDGWACAQVGESLSRIYAPDKDIYTPAGVDLTVGGNYLGCVTRAANWNGFVCPIYYGVKPAQPASCADDYRVGTAISTTVISATATSGITITLPVTVSAGISSSVFMVETSGGPWYASVTDTSQQINKRYDAAGSPDGADWRTLPDVAAQKTWGLCYAKVPPTGERLYFQDPGDHTVNFRVNDVLPFTDNSGSITITTWTAEARGGNLLGDGNMEYFPDSPYWKMETNDNFGRANDTSSNFLYEFGGITPACGHGFQIVGYPPNLAFVYTNIKQDINWPGGTLSWRLSADSAFGNRVYLSDATTEYTLVDIPAAPLSQFAWHDFSGNIENIPAGTYTFHIGDGVPIGNTYVDDVVISVGADTAKSACYLAPDPAAVLQDTNFEQYPTSDYWFNEYSSQEFGRFSQRVGDNGTAYCGDGFQGVGQKGMGPANTYYGPITQTFTWDGGTMYWRFAAHYGYGDSSGKLTLAVEDITGERTYLVQNQALTQDWQVYFGQTTVGAGGPYKFVIEPEFPKENLWQSMSYIDDLAVGDIPPQSACAAGGGAGGGSGNVDNLGDGNMEQYPKSDYWDSSNSEFCRYSNTVALDTVVNGNASCGDGFQGIGQINIIDNRPCGNINQIFSWSGGPFFWRFSAHRRAGLVNVDADIPARLNAYLSDGSGQKHYLTAENTQLETTWAAYTGTFDLPQGTYKINFDLNPDDAAITRVYIDDVAISHSAATSACDTTTPPVTVGALGDGDMEQYPTSNYWFPAVMGDSFGRFNPTKGTYLVSYGQPACGDGYQVAGRTLLDVKNWGAARQEFTWSGHGDAMRWSIMARGDGLSPTANVYISGAGSVYKLLDHVAAPVTWTWYTGTLTIPEGQYTIFLENPVGLPNSLNSYVAFDNVSLGATFPADCRSNPGGTNPPGGGDTGYDWGTECKRPTNWLNVAQWVDYGVCRVLGFFTWSTGNTRQVQQSLDKLYQYEPFGTIKETRDAVRAFNDEINSPKWNWNSAGLPGQGITGTLTLTGTLGAPSTVWYGQPWRISNTGQTYSTTCSAYIVTYTGPLLGQGICFVFDVLNKRGLMPWVQFFLNLISLAWFIGYIRKKWIDVGVM